MSAHGSGHQQGETFLVLRYKLLIHLVLNPRDVNVAPRYLYNLSQPWITHYSIQHVHNRPADLWRIFGRKPFVWDEVKCLLRSNESICFATHLTAFE